MTKTFALFPNLQKPDALKLATAISEFLIAKHCTVVAADDVAAALGCSPLSSVDPASISFMVSMGGDGSILRLAHRYPHIKAPVIGINLGSLGFLADIRVSELYPSLQEILDGKYSLTPRLILEGDNFFAINDIIIHRAKNPSLIDLSVHVNGTYLNTFSADGVIISTPSGSTAYSLSAGGPILSPDLDAIVITPICPHTTTCAPIVLNPKHEISIQYLSTEHTADVITDGIVLTSLKSGEIISCRKSTRQFHLVTLQSHDYYSTLRTKLNWSGTLKM